MVLPLSSAVIAPKLNNSLPLSVQIEQNELLSRCAIDFLGGSVPDLVMARNKYERLENLLDESAWLLAGVLVPFVIVGPAAKALERRLLNKMMGEAAPHLLKGQSLLHLPFQALDRAKWPEQLKQLIKEEGKAGSEAQALLKQTGLHSFKQLPEALGKGLLNIKLGIVFADLGILALKGQSIPRLKNWMTAKLSGKEGFSGILNYASDAYLKKQQEENKKTSKQRLAVSLGLGALAAIGFPTLLAAVLYAPSHKGVIGQLKNMSKLFNYNSVVFMTKPVLLVHNLCNYVAPSLLASRDSNELRERMTTLALYDAFFFLGDDAISGIIAKMLQERHLLETPIVTAGRLPRLRNLNTILTEAGRHSQAFKLAERSFWGGIVGAALGLGVCVRLANFIYTRKKVIKAEQALAQPKTTTPPTLLNHLAPTSINSVKTPTKTNSIDPFSSTLSVPYQIQGLVANGVTSTSLRVPADSPHTGVLPSPATNKGISSLETPLQEKVLREPNELLFPQEL